MSGAPAPPTQNEGSLLAIIGDEVHIRGCITAHHYTQDFNGPQAESMAQAAIFHDALCSGLCEQELYEAMSSSF